MRPRGFVNPSVRNSVAYYLEDRSSQKYEDLKIEDGRYVRDIYSNILEILYLDYLVKLIYNKLYLNFEYLAHVRNVLDRQPLIIIVIFYLEIIVYSWIDLLNCLLSSLSFITLWDYWVLCSNFDPPEAILSSVSLQTFTGFYVVESSVMSSIWTQVHVTIC